MDFLDYTTEVTLEISGANENDEGYYINENEEYEVLCRANGNPAPQVTILGTDSVEIPVSKIILRLKIYHNITPSSFRIKLVLKYKTKAIL